MRLADVKSLIGQEVRFKLPHYKPRKMENGVRNVYFGEIEYHGKFVDYTSGNRYWWVKFQDFKMGECELSKSKVGQITHVEIIHRKKVEPKVREGANDKDIHN